MKVAVVNLKGGSGKTVSSFHLATAFAERGRTLLADCDEQGSALSWASSIEEDGGEVGFSMMGLPVKDVHRRVRDFEADYVDTTLRNGPGSTTSSDPPLPSQQSTSAAVYGPTFVTSSCSRFRVR